MRTRLRKLLLIGVAGALTLGVAIPASAQSGWRWDRDRGRDRDEWRDRDYRNSRPYQDGYRDGRRDSERRRSARPNDRRWKTDWDRRAYYGGYRDGYRSWANSRSPYGYGVFGSGGNNRDGQRGNLAAQIGYQDGYSVGLRDRQTGHSFRPTYHKAYKDADHGYLSGMGNKSYYKQEYRQAFMNGYQRGYYQGRR